MGYLDLGMTLAQISAPIVIYYWLTAGHRYNENLTNWWNGKRYDSNLIPLEIIITILISFCFFIIIFVAYPIIIGGAIIAMIVISLRNKRVAKINIKNNKRDGKINNKESIRTL